MTTQSELDKRFPLAVGFFVRTEQAQRAATLLAAAMELKILANNSLEPVPSKSHWVIGVMLSLATEWESLAQEAEGK